LKSEESKGRETRHADQKLEQKASRRWERIMSDVAREKGDVDRPGQGKVAILLGESVNVEAHAFEREGGKAHGRRTSDYRNPSHSERRKRKSWVILPVREEKRETRKQQRRREKERR